jgi:protein involved in polysaccharide export with SLBB domain
MSEMSGFLWAHGGMLAWGVTLVLGCGALAVGMLGWVMPAARSVVVRQRVCELSVVAGVVWLVVASVPLPRVGWRAEERPREVAGVAAPQAVEVTGSVEIPPELIARPRVVEEARRGEEAARGREAEVTPKAEAQVQTPVVAAKRARMDWGLWLARLFVGGAGVCVGWLVLGRVVLWRMIRGSRAAPGEVRRVLEGMMEGCGDGSGLAKESGAAHVSQSSTSSTPAWREKRGCARAPRVWVTPGLSRPVTFGVWRPVILVPESLLAKECAGQLRQVLLHEVGHIRPGDGWGNLLFCLALPVLYWHPLYWWLRRSSSLLRELVADDWAARRDGKEAYVTELVALARTRMAGWTGAVGAMGILQNRSDFYRRMRMLLQRQTALATGCSSGCRAMLAAATLTVVVGMGAMVGVTPARGQTAGGSAAAAKGAGDEGTAAARGDRVIRRNDVLKVSMSGLTGPGTGFVEQLRVSDEGRVKLPLLGSLKVEGLTPAEAEQAIRQKYRDANLIQNTKVSIGIMEAKEAAVSQPGLAKTERLIQIDDVLHLSRGKADAGTPMQVNARGNVYVAPIGSIKAAGLTSAELEKAIAQKMRDANLVNSNGPLTVRFGERTADVAEDKGGAIKGGGGLPQTVTGDPKADPQKIAKTTDAQIGMADSEVRKMLDKREALEARVKQLRDKGYGAQHPELVQANEELDYIKAKIQKHVQDWRNDQVKRAETIERALTSKGGMAAGSGVQLDLVSLANSTVEAAGAVRVAKAEVALKRKLKESGAANDLERDQANLETAVKRLELLKGIAAIALEGATQELARAKQLYQQGVQSEREVSDAQSRVKMLQLIVNSAG